MSGESWLGREAIETAYRVRVFFYREDRERTLDSPTDKIMLSLTAFADELERDAEPAARSSARAVLCVFDPSSSGAGCLRARSGAPWPSWAPTTGPTPR
jgi:hypothetical protein